MTPDRDKLKEKIAQTIATVDGETDWDYVRSISNHPIYGLAMEQADAALSAIESSGYVLMPKDPTSEMIAKVRWLGETSVREVYAAMLAGVRFKEPSDG